MDGDDFCFAMSGSMRTPAIEDLEAVTKMQEEEDLKIIAQGGNEVLSDGLRDNSLIMLEREWVESQMNKGNELEMSGNNIQVLTDSEDEEDIEDR